MAQGPDGRRIVRRGRARKVNRPAFAVLRRTVRFVREFRADRRATALSDSLEPVTPGLRSARGDTAGPPRPAPGRCGGLSRAVRPAPRWAAWVLPVQAAGFLSGWGTGPVRGPGPWSWSGVSGLVRGGPVRGRVAGPAVRLSGCPGPRRPRGACGPGRSPCPGPGPEGRTRGW